MNGRPKPPHAVAQRGWALDELPTCQAHEGPHIGGMPFSISFEPTTACNLRCPECPSGLRSFTRPTGNLKQDLFTRVIDELAPDLWALTFYFQGEPYINPGFLDMVRYAHEKGLYTATSTNAHFLGRCQGRGHRAQWTVTLDHLLGRHHAGNLFSLSEGRRTGEGDRRHQAHRGMEEEV